MKSVGLEADPPALPSMKRAKEKTSRQTTSFAMDLKDRDSPDGVILMERLKSQDLYL